MGLFASTAKKNPFMYLAQLKQRNILHWPYQGSIQIRKDLDTFICKVLNK